MAEKNNTLLKVENLHVYYDAIHAIKGISFEVPAGSIVTLIGSNGAGKSTILKTISHLLDSTQGLVDFEGIDLTKVAPHKIVEMGIVHIPEGRRVFSGLTVQENIEMGAYTVKNHADVVERMKDAYAHFPRLKERKHQLAGTLSGGEQQMLAMARAMMARPRILLMDEPSMGLAPLLVDEIFNIIEKINKEYGTTILLVEQNANRALQVSNYGYVLETGNIIAEGKSDQLLKDPKVIEAYLSA
jgi:branched-chain amino acid transport system ATP-binding protein